MFFFVDFSKSLIKLDRNWQIIYNLYCFQILSDAYMLMYHRLMLCIFELKDCLILMRIGCILFLVFV